MGVISKLQAAVIQEEALRNGWKWAEKIDWDALARGCDGQLDFTESLVNGDAFSSSLDQLLQQAKAKLASESVAFSRFPHPTKSRRPNMSANPETVA